MADKKPLPPLGTCKTIYNPRTRRCAQLCVVPGKKDRPRWSIQAGSSHTCQR